MTYIDHVKPSQVWASGNADYVEETHRVILRNALNVTSWRSQYRCKKCGWGVDNEEHTETYNWHTGDRNYYHPRCNPN